MSSPTKTSVLIAEDDAVSRELLCKNLTSWGYKVILTKDGEEAWNAIIQNRSRILILDWMMPKLNGLDICRKVRETITDRYTYIILMTANTDANDVIEGLTAGADDYITKPFKRPELKARLATGQRIINLETQLLETQKRLHELATRDGLTDLWNRTAILKILEEETERSRREQTPLGVIMIDIDHFKDVNDSCGHLSGDAVLVAIARRLMDNVRPYDKIGRYGGDEILIVLPHSSCANLEIIADRLQKAIADKKFIVPGYEPLEVTISIGGTSYDGIEKKPVDSLIMESDTALYEAKNEGRNRYKMLKITGKNK
ncbi:MAG: diguanylate cyclase [Candidatus Aminicenantes bacterium]|nr:diguanylate cyclase [Candidatus Aminicenantes bacterium]